MYRVTRFLKLIFNDCLARAAWFAYLSPDDADILYKKYLGQSQCDIFDEMYHRQLAFHDLMTVIAASPTYIHSPLEDTDVYLIETKEHELWVIWRGTQEGGNIKKIPYSQTNATSICQKFSVFNNL